MLRKVFFPYIQGIAIGIGNIIPGVSGGTIALILGIYERLLNAITNIRLKTVISFFYIFSKRDVFLEEMKKCDVVFLIQLLLGALTAIFSLSYFFSYLLDFHREATFSFFTGLILFSVFVPYKMLTRRSYKEWIGLIVGVIFVVLLGVMQNVQEYNAVQQLQQKEVKVEQLQSSATKTLSYIQSDGQVTFTKYVIYFLAGIIAISAMILPGISGSFVLLLIGLYYEILVALKYFYFPTLISFALGCVVGLLLFSHFLKWILKHFFNVTLAFLIGLIIGSLYCMYPFKEIFYIHNVPFYTFPKLPDMNMHFFVCLILFFVAGFVVLLLEKLSQHSTQQ
ncbi:MAG TPA: DUF368 domain-containing protein [Planctomycetota bacterium]|nr:DUF368 domain-containing protein [Planctomycetota bacterium]